MAAEGSDWFWWYGKPNSSDFEEEFDYLFRAYLIQVYKELNAEPPEDLHNPITERIESEDELSLFPITPIIDGHESHFYEWVGARIVDTSEFSGTMNLGQATCERLYYGLSKDDFYIRIDPSGTKLATHLCEILILFTGEEEAALSIRYLSSKGDLLAAWQASQSPLSEPEVAFEHILEIKIPVVNLKGLGHNIKFAVVVKMNNLEVERWPREGHYTCPFPTPEFLSMNWVI